MDIREHPAKPAMESERSSSFDITFPDHGEVDDAALGNALQASIDRLKQELCLPPETFNDLFSALDEVLVNAIKHGNKRDPKKKVSVAWKASPQRLELTVTDEGEGFNEGDNFNPIDDDHLLESHGRGLLIMRHAFDEVQTFKRKGGGFTVRMVKNLKDETSS